MTTIQHHKIVPYSCAQMYQLINNVAAYPTFLPWCTQSKVLSESLEEMVAAITVKELVSFTTKNQLIPNTSIDLQLQSGPFKQLHGHWQFTEISADESRIDLLLEFTFSNKLLTFTFSSVFEKIGHELIKAFVKRAGELYDQN